MESHQSSDSTTKKGSAMTTQEYEQHRAAIEGQTLEIVNTSTAELYDKLTVLLRITDHESPNSKMLKAVCYMSCANVGLKVALLMAKANQIDNAAIAQVVKEVKTN